jgi:hypothetical protein
MPSWDAVKFQVALLPIMDSIVSKCSCSWATSLRRIRVSKGREDLSDASVKFHTLPRAIRLDKPERLIKPIVDAPESEALGSDLTVSARAFGDCETHKCLRAGEVFVEFLADP